MSLDIQ